MVSKLETIDLRHLRAFAEVARRRGVTAAADALGRPKSAISKSLSALERQVGVRLLERSTRRIALTPTGILLLSRAESILSDMDRLEEDIRLQSREVRGVVRMTAPPELGALLSESFIPSVLRSHASLEIGIDLGYAFDDLLDPRFDLAFRLGSIHDDRLVARRLGEFFRIAVASPAYLKSNPLRAPADLAHCNCLAFSATEHQAVWTLQRRSAGRDKEGGKVEEISVRGNFAAHGFSALMHAAAAGLGVARVPEFAARSSIMRGELVRVLPAWSAPPTEVFLVHRFGQERIQRVKAVIDASLIEVSALFNAAAPVRRSVGPRGGLSWRQD